MSSEKRNLLPEHMFKLGTPVTDIATGLTGMLTHCIIEMGGNLYYSFQPRGLNLENGAPVNRLWISASRVNGGEKIPAYDLPLYVLGTLVEDTGSGFSGIATALVQHISGCAHVTIQPTGNNPKTGGPIEAHDFDLRRCKGAAVPVLTESERDQSEKAKPSPMDATFSPHRPL